MFKRVGLFIITNLLVMVTISIVWSIASYFLGAHQITGYIPVLIAFSLVWGMGGAFISLLMSKWMAKTFNNVQIIDPKSNHPEHRELVEKIYFLARKAQLSKMPEVGIYDSMDVNAFATGPSKNNSLVAVSTGLLRQMNSHEVEGVLAHEIAHIANGDMVTMTLIQGIVNAFVLFFSRVLANIIASQVDEKYENIVRFVATIIGDIAFTLLGSIVVNYFSRTREFRADKGSAKYSSPSNMIAALKKLQSIHTMNDPANEGSDALATLKISSTRPSGFMALFMTHPSLEDRIAALEGQRV